jgi:hypothetical protein
MADLTLAMAPRGRGHPNHQRRDLRNNARHTTNQAPAAALSARTTNRSIPYSPSKNELPDLGRIERLSSRH